MFLGSAEVRADWFRAVSRLVALESILRGSVLVLLELAAAFNVKCKSFGVAPSMCTVRTERLNR